MAKVFKKSKKPDKLIVRTEDKLEKDTICNDQLYKF